MRDRYHLRSVGNSELLTELSALVARGNELTADVLAHLAELDERRLHLELGFPSLFAYCTESSLGLSEPAAGRRIAAARVCRRFPVAFELVAHGDLHLSALCALGPHLNASNASELFSACRRKTRRKIEELLAARFPAPDVRAQIRRLPNPPAIAVTTETERPVDTEVPRPNGHDAPAQQYPPVSQLPPTPRGASQRRAVEPLSTGRFGIHFTADAQLREKFEQARALASHRLPSGDLAALFELALDALIRELEKQRFGVGRKPRIAGLPTEANPETSNELSPRESSAQPRSVKAPCTRRRSSRHIPAAVARKVYLQDQRQCSFMSPDGRRCAARSFLELDHINPWAEGGAPTVQNLRLRCRAHNQHQARLHFGDDRVQAAIERAARHPNRLER